jgi:hypothetical protein
MPSQAVTNALRELDAIRLDHDWTFAVLADRMAAAVGVRFAPRTLYYLLKRLPPAAEPHDRTVHKIQTYLDHMRRDPAERQRVRKAAAKKAAAAKVTA